MKKCFTFIWVVFLALSCSDDDKPSNPIDRLPAATQTGENTFGCLVNGEAFTPSGSGFSGPYLDCTYEYLDGEFYFALQGNRRKNGKLQVVGIVTREKEIQEGQTYQLINYVDGNASGAWWYNPNEEYEYIYTSQTHSGELNISRLDIDNHIVSGTFWFDILLPDGETVEVREGRFDMQFVD